MKYQLEAACFSHKGKKRCNNEDNFYFDGAIRAIDSEVVKFAFTGGMDSIERSLFAVFDGMGGETDGEVASYLAAEQLQQGQQILKRESETPETCLKMLMRNLNRAVCSRAEVSFSRMGTTAVVLYLMNDEIYICNIGDSRAYCMHEGRLSQISVDHTDAALLAEMNITNRKPSLNQYIGIPEDEFWLEPHIVRKRCFPNDQYMLCSDGLTDMVSVEEIAKIMSEKQTAEERVEKLMQAALDNGGEDNITIVLICIKGLAEIEI